MTLSIHSSLENGVTRLFTRWTALVPRLAILLLHPTGGSSKSALLGGQWTDKPGITVWAPEGLGFDASQPASAANPRAWSSRCGPMAERSFDDASYLLNLARELKESVGPDVPLCLVGHSNGCAIGFNQLLSNQDHPFDMAVLYAANWAHPTTTVRRIPLLYMAGACDPIYPWNESHFVETPWFSYQTVPTQPTVEAWLAATGLTGEVRQGPAEDSAGSLTSWCAEDGVTFEFRVLAGQGHHWPAGLPLDSRLQQVLGPNNENLSATDIALEFLTRNAKVLQRGEQMLA